MKFMHSFFPLMLAAAGPAMAQDAPETLASPASRWSFGIGAAISGGIYAGEGSRVTPFPVVSYEGTRFFWQGIGGGVHLFRRGGLVVDATLSARMDGIDRDDFGRAELAARGIDRALLEDRDDALDAGLAVRWRGSAGELAFGIKGDVTGASKGHEAFARYAYPWHAGSVRISPYAGVSRLSNNMAGYYYGTLPEEVRRGVASYQPGSAIVPRVGVEVAWPVAQRWTVMGNLAYRRLPGKLADSPLLDRDAAGSVSAFIGLARGF